MKITSLLALGLVLGAQTHAAEPMLAQRFSIGFAKTPRTEVITVYNDGNVYGETTYHRTGEVESKFLGALPEAVLARVTNAVKKLPEGKLVDQNEGEPPCMDAPTRTHSLFRDGTEIVLRKVAGCHTYVLTETKIGKRNQLLAIINGFASLYRIR